MRAPQHIEGIFFREGALCVHLNDSVKQEKAVHSICSVIEYVQTYYTFIYIHIHSDYLKHSIHAVYYCI